MLDAILRLKRLVTIIEKRMFSVSQVKVYEWSSNTSWETVARMLARLRLLKASVRSSLTKTVSAD